MSTTYKLTSLKTHLDRNDYEWLTGQFSQEDIGKIITGDNRSHELVDIFDIEFTMRPEINKVDGTKNMVRDILASASDDIKGAIRTLYGINIYPYLPLKEESQPFVWGDLIFSETEIVGGVFDFTLYNFSNKKDKFQQLAHLKTELASPFLDVKKERHVNTERTIDGWSLEIAIPFSTIIDSPLVIEFNLVKKTLKAGFSAPQRTVDDELSNSTFSITDTEGNRHAVEMSINNLSLHFRTAIPLLRCL